jgi:hypothetical protein
MPTSIIAKRLLVFNSTLCWRLFAELESARINQIS